MKLEEYVTIEEKSNFFTNGGSKIIFDIDDVFIKLSRFTQEGNGYIFRGCNEAKYKLYNSAQRIYLNQELYKQVDENQITEHYKEFVVSLIKNCKTWNNGVITKLFESSGIEKNNDIAYLSFMQHYGVPTPFLDYSYNPYVSLYHAIDNIVYNPSNNEIDNYFSLYTTFESTTMLQCFKHVFDKNVKQVDSSYETIESNKMSIIPANEEFYKIINSVNIINQEGLFLFNNHPYFPFEKAYKEFVLNLTVEKGKTKLDELKIHPMASACFNIHKSLVPAIKEKLKELGINKTYIYPDMLNLKKAVTNEGILNSLT